MLFPRGTLPDASAQNGVSSVSGRSALKTGALTVRPLELARLLPPRWYQRRFVRRALVVAGLLLLMAPYWSLLEVMVLGADGSGWMEMARPDGWRTVENIFLKGHFIGYRPVTALTFVIGSQVDQQWLVRGVDLCIWFFCLLTFFQVLWRGLRLSTVLCSLGTAALALHPVVEDVLMFSDRRGDLLVTWFSIGYLGAILRGSQPMVRSMWLLLALGSKESAFALPFALLLSRATHSPLPWKPRIAAALRSALPDFGLWLAFLALRWMILRSLGGYRGGGWNGDRTLVPLDYLANVFVPHFSAMAMLSYGIAAGFALLVLGLSIRLFRAMSFAQHLLACALVSDLLLYIFVGFVEARLLLAATAFAVAFLAAGLRRRRAALLPVALIVLPWSILHLSSDPEGRIQGIGRQVGRYVKGLRAEVETLPPGDHQLLLCDCPEGWERTLLQKRLDLNKPANRIGTGRDILLTHIHLARLLNPLWDDRKVHFLSLVHLSLESPDASWSVRVAPLGEDSLPDGVHVDLSLRGASAHVFSSYAQMSPCFVEQGSTLTRVHTGAALPRRGSSHLFVHATEGDKLLPHPRILDIELFKRAAPGDRETADSSLAASTAESSPPPAR